MRFAGYIPLRRGLLEHTYDGRLTNNEALVLVYLILLADKETGSGTINGPTLRTFLPGLSADAAKRTLSSLQKKRYIWRKITHRSALVYPYWIDKFVPTVGPHMLRQLDISQVFISRDPKDLRYVTPALGSAPEGAPDTALEGAPEGAQYNETRKEKPQKKKPETPSIDMKEGTSMSDEKRSLSETVVYAKRNPCVPCGERMVSTEGSHGDSNSERMVIPMDAKVYGLRRRQDGEYIATNTGEVVPFKTATALIREHTGLVWQGGEFHDKAGNRVPLDRAQSTIGTIRITLGEKRLA